MFSWLYSHTPKEEDALKVLDYLRYTSNVEFFMRVLKSAVETWPEIHIAFFKQYVDGKDLLESSVDMVKMMMIEWPEDLSKPMAGLLNANNIVAAKAMGSEKSKFNKTYYTEVRKAIKMSPTDFRAFLVEARKGWDLVNKNYDTTKPYCLALFNEPLVFNITNIKCNEDIPIISMYKGEINKHDYMYDPTKTQLETPLTQADVYKLQKNLDQDVPLVIISTNIDENVVPPKNVWLIFTETTKSWGDRIVPFFHEKGHSVIVNLMDFLEN